MLTCTFCVQDPGVHVGFGDSGPRFCWINDFKGVEFVVFKGSIWIGFTSFSLYDAIKAL